jgi:hypothetical protein
MNGGPLLLTHHIDSSSAPQTPPGGSATQASIRRRDRPTASGSMGAGPATLGRMPRPPNTAQPASDRYLHWCIDDREGVTRLIHIDLSSVTDSNLIPCLLQTYNSVRGFRSWLTLTSCCGVRLIKVRFPATFLFTHRRCIVSQAFRRIRSGDYIRSYPMPYDRPRL